MSEPKMGDTAICLSCDQPIEYIGPYWRHKGEHQPRHIAMPKDGALTPAELPTLYAVQSQDGLWLRFADAEDLIVPGNAAEVWGRYRQAPAVDGWAAYWTERLSSFHFGNYREGMADVARQAGGRLVAFRLEVLGEV